MSLTFPEKITNYSKRLETINHIIGTVIAWGSGIIVFLTFINVVQRYLFATNHIWQSELILCIHSLIFLSTVGYTLKDNRHVRVDVFYSHFPDFAKAWVDLIGTLLFLIPTALLISYFSYDFITNAWSIKEASREADGLAGIYIVKTFIYLFSATLLLQACALILQSIAVIYSKKNISR